MFAEKYRPQKVSDVILQPTVKKKINTFLRRGDLPNMIFSGASGTGKTSLAKAIVHTTKCDFIMLNASIDNSIDVVRKKIINFASTVSLSMASSKGKHTKKIVILDEADNMSKQMQKALRGLIEDVHNNCRFIFTCNYDQRILPAIISRCEVLTFELDSVPSVRSATKKLCEDILKKEKIKLKDKTALDSHIDALYPDIRAIVSGIENSVVNGVFELNTSIKATPKQDGEITIDCGNRKKLILRPARSKNYMMSVYVDGGRKRRSSGTDDLTLAKHFLDEFYDELYADQAITKQVLLNNIQKMEEQLKVLKTYVKSIKD